MEMVLIYIIISLKYIYFNICIIIYYLYINSACVSRDVTVTLF